MNAAVAMNEAYLEVWGERPFSNVPIICAWKKEDVRRWLFNKIPCTIKKQPEEEIALPLDLVEMLPGSDCVVFAIHVLDRRPSAGSFVHNGSHGAHMGLIDERFVIVDSTARQAFALREGEKFGEENKSVYWHVEQGVLHQTPGGPLEEVSKKEVVSRTCHHQWQSKTAVVMFRCVIGGKGRFCGSVAFEPKSSKVIWSMSKNQILGDMMVTKNQDIEACFKALDLFARSCAKEAKLGNGEGDLKGQWENVRPALYELLCAWIAVKGEEKRLAAAKSKSSSSGSL